MPLFYTGDTILQLTDYWQYKPKFQCSW